MDTRYTVQDINRLLDVSSDDSGTDSENSSDNQSDFDLSDPEAQLQEINSSAVPDNDSSNKLTGVNNPAGVFSSIISYNQLDTDGYHDNDVNHSTETTKGNNFSHRRGRARSRT